MKSRTQQQLFLIFRIKSLCLLIALGFGASVGVPEAHALKICTALMKIGFKHEVFYQSLRQDFIKKMTAAYPAFGFRQAQPSDLPELQALINEVRGTYIVEGESLNTVFDDDLVRMNEVFKSSQSSLFVITDQNGKIVGSGGFGRTAAGEAELRKIYLLPVFHGTGLGRKWIGELTALAKDMNIKRIWLINHIKLPRATAVYWGLGYRDFVPSVEEVHGLTVNQYRFLELKNLQSWKPQK